MKKILFFAAITFLTFPFANAQEINFGAKAGVNFASIGGDETDEYNGKIGFHLGVIAELLLTERLALQPEILYSSQGAKGEYSYSFEGEETTNEVDIKLNYINIPLLAKYYVTERLSLKAGPQVGFLLSAKNEYTETSSFEGETEIFSSTEDIKDDMNSIDFGLAAGVGYKLDMGLFFNARYVLGLSNIHDFEDEDENFSQKNNVFQVSVGYMF